jgi:hypothetical protein
LIFKDLEKKPFGLLRLFFAKNKRSNPKGFFSNKICILLTTAWKVSNLPIRCKSTIYVLLGRFQTFQAVATIYVPLGRFQTFQAVARKK